MSQSQTPPRGRIVWWELAAKNVQKAAEFHLGLFPSWQISPGENHLRINLQGTHISGIHPSDDGASMWTPFVTTPDVEETCSQIQAAGGTIMAPPSDIPKVGRFAVAKDPEGATFAPMALGNHPPEHSGPMPPGAFCWHELRSKNPAQAIAFYSAIFGWDETSIPMGSAPYTLFRRGEKEACGMVHLPPDSGVKPGWLAYVYSADVDASLKLAEGLGATPEGPVEHVVGVGQRASLIDPFGAVIALFRSERG